MNHWITGQQIGLLAYMWWHATGRHSRTHPVALALEKELENRLYAEAEPENEVSIRCFLQGLPPSTLALLRLVTEHHEKQGDLFYPIRDRMHDGLPWLTNVNAYGNKAASTRLARATMWGDHVLMTQASAKRLKRLARSFFGKRWKMIEQRNKIVPALEDTLDVLRDSWATTRQRCNAVEQVSKVTQEGPDWFTQIENYLYHRQFFWPLLVVKTARGETISFSLPVAVEIHPPSPAYRPKRKDQPEEVQIKGTEDFLDAAGWREPLERSVSAGKNLWRSKHGNYGAFRRDVMSRQTSVVFDFSYASEVVRPVSEAVKEAQDGAGADGYSLELVDRSAEAYFAQAVLNGLLGKTNIQANVASGAIGEQGGLNYRLEKPAGIPAKLRYVFLSRRFEQVVLPREAKVDGDEYIGSDDSVEQTTRLKYAGDLGTMTDVMQRREWRQYRYVRCPGIKWAIHNDRDRSRPGLLSRQNRAVQDVLDLLGENEKHVRTVNAAPTAVASALWHINREEKWERDPNDVPPDLSWAFIRVYENEGDVAFWHMVWDVIGAPVDDFEKFLSSAAPPEAVDHLKKALNRFSPNFKRPHHRAPDVLVIVGSDHLEGRYQESPMPKAQSLAVPPIMDHLRESLEGVPDERMTRLIGDTRILLIPNDEERSVEPANISSNEYCSPDHPLRKLSTFRSGFTQHMADLMLEGAYEDKTLRTEVLDPLVEEDLLREIGGTYHLPKSVEKRLGFWKMEMSLKEEEQNLEEEAQRHFRAGCALAPYVTATRHPSIESYVSFSPEYMREAWHHFLLAHDLAKRSKATNLYENVRDAMRNLLFYHMPPCWEKIGRLLEFGSLPECAHEESTKLLEEEENTNAVEAHPRHWTLAAQTSWKYGKFMKESKPDVEDHLYEEAEERFVQALQRSSNYPSEEYPIQVFALSRYAEFLEEIFPDKFFEVAEDLRDTIESWASGGQGASDVPGAQVSALESAGDQIRDHTEAFRFYRAGTWVGPYWTQNWIKGLGAAVLAGDTEQIEDIESEISDPDAQELCDRIGQSIYYMKEDMRRRDTRGDTSMAEHVEQRVEIGIERVEAMDSVGPPVPRN
jgi:hypothetical protein